MAMGASCNFDVVNIYNFALSGGVVALILGSKIMVFVHAKNKK